MENVEFRTLETATIISASNGSRVALSRHLPGFLLLSAIDLAFWHAVWLYTSFRMASYRTATANTDNNSSSAKNWMGQSAAPYRPVLSPTSYTYVNHPRNRWQVLADIYTVSDKKHRFPPSTALSNNPISRRQCYLSHRLPPTFDI